MHKRKKSETLLISTFGPLSSCGSQQHELGHRYNAYSDVGVAFKKSKEKFSKYSEFYEVKVCAFLPPNFRITRYRRLQPIYPGTF